MVVAEDIQRIVIVGGPGGRERAIEQRLLQERPQLEITHVPVLPIDQLMIAIAAVNPDFVISGSEVPIAEGLADRLKAKRIPCFAPSQVAAQLETSKSFAIRIMDGASRRGSAQSARRSRNTKRVPHPRSRILYRMKDVERFFWPQMLPLVVKEDGLTGGKGVTIAETKEQFFEAVGRAFQNHPGRPVVIQRFVQGIEMSVFAFTDGTHISPLVSAQDYKRRFDDENAEEKNTLRENPMTGGMGAYSPHILWSKILEQQVKDRVFQPVLQTMRQLGMPFRGFLYAGLMLVVGENMRLVGFEVLEFNCRLGDPEAQVILPRLRGDFLAMMVACAEGNSQAELPSISWERDGDSSIVAVGVVTTGYPGQESVEAQERLPNIVLRTPDPAYPERRRGDARVLATSKVQEQTDGTFRVVGPGRVLWVVSEGNLKEAARQAFNLAQEICSQAEGLLDCRTDIAEVM